VEQRASLQFLRHDYKDPHKEKPSLPYLRHDNKDPQRKGFFTIIVP
jgi:hypothetical protein